MSAPRHIEKSELFCNRCNKYVRKHTETYLENGEVHCLFCHNWLCGEYDAFGDLGDLSPSLKHIKILSQDAQTRQDWR